MGNSKKFVFHQDQLVWNLCPTIRAYCLSEWILMVCKSTSLDIILFMKLQGTHSKEPNKYEDEREIAGIGNNGHFISRDVHCVEWTNHPIQSSSRVETRLTIKREI